MRVYETTFILSPQADDATLDRQIRSVADLITRYQGKVLHEDRWGIRRLAYPIKKFTQGFYTRIVFEGGESVLSELDRFFKIEDPFIRHLTVLFEGKLEKEEKSERAAEPMSESEPTAETEVKRETEPVSAYDSAPTEPTPASEEPVSVEEPEPEEGIELEEDEL
jgi:small subunit ribosomal protein S6